MFDIEIPVPFKGNAHLLVLQRLIVAGSKSKMLDAKNSNGKLFSINMPVETIYFWQAANIIHERDTKMQFDIFN